MAVDSCAVNTQGSASPARDPLAILDSLATHTDAAITAFAPLLPDLSPLDVEIACIHILNGSIRTITNLARLREQAADAPESHAFDEPTVRLAAIAAHNRHARTSWRHGGNEHRFPGDNNSNCSYATRPWQNGSICCKGSSSGRPR